MTVPVVVRPSAEADIESIEKDLDGSVSGLGQRFLSRLREVLERIESNPGMYGVLWEDVRAVRLKKFRYVVYYVALKDQTEVIAVLHGSRDNPAWQSRR